MEQVIDNNIKLTIYEFIMPAIGVVLTFIMGNIAKKMNNISKDISEIKTALVTHDMTAKELRKDVDEVYINCKENAKEIQKINIQLAKL